MRLIIGGAYQGKTEYVKEKYGVAPVSCLPEEALKATAVNGYHLLVEQLLAEGMDPKEYTKRLISENPDVIVVCDEVGMGVVPLDKEIRIWREAVGRCLKLLAAAADSVVRIYAGIEVVVK